MKLKLSFKQNGLDQNIEIDEGEFEKLIDALMKASVHLGYEPKEE